MTSYRIITADHPIEFQRSTWDHHGIDRGQGEENVGHTSAAACKRNLFLHTDRYIVH
jgi:hypothetical protein